MLTEHFATISVGKCYQFSVMVTNFRFFTIFAG